MQNAQSSAAGREQGESATLRVLHATPSFAPAYCYGGPIRSLEGLVVALAKMGIHVRMLTTDANGAERLDVGNGWRTWRGVPVRYARRWAAPDLAPSFAIHVVREIYQADLVHVTGLFSTPSMVALAAALAVGRPVVLSPRGALEPYVLAEISARKKRAWLRAFRPLLRSVAAFHATSEAEARSIRAVLGDVRVRVVPNGTEISTTMPCETEERPPIIAAMGRIHPVKAFERLIEAVAELRRRGVSCKLRIAGPVQDVAYRADLDRLLVRLGFDAASCFVGEVQGEEKRRFYARARVFVLPSHSENFGNVVVEALAEGTPVIASRGTPWAELESAGCGRWVDNIPGALADAMEPYLRDAHAAAQAGRAGRTLVESRYTWDAIARSMSAIYHEVLGTERTQTRGRSGRWSTAAQAIAEPSALWSAR